MPITSEQRAFIKHRIAKELDTREVSKDASGARKATGMSDAEFAHVIGRPIDTIKSWARTPAILAAIRKGLDDATSSRDYFKLCMRQLALEEMWLNYLNAADGTTEKRQWHTAIMAETKDVADTGDAVDYEGLSEEDLLSLCLEREVTPAGMTPAQLRERLRECQSSTSSSDSSSVPDSLAEDCGSDGPCETVPAS